ncbi:hypothetical protein [Pectobacterium carotovorum]|uniref:Uncharacterized protein n=1 Tax=Pectobacterium carotovorum subsp. carotovorum TaxID=555 RepID=A0AAI9PEE6_PECCC|nr:hypothetical protein [Pectobacterium carotovorum]KAA3666641.1 hypothetical protein FEV48_16005 [Pectobacterium carotovorum subsp. carotovorum]MCA6968505.1 hypothetical protein [Pectobacterium carotovorum]MCA6975570.1 hypothetical protein [Pectobacterium carotovorum]UCZ80022.1 hypothetical protein LHL03_02405 [Pectobacterium carotovorum]WDF99404.1 hypothetical protein PSR30_02205 [Pectobacterium carotovorum subsp. carotovorum]
MKRLKTSEQVNQNMSYEYKLVFDNASAAQDVMRTIKRSETCIRAENGDVYLKDKSLNNCAEYDIRLIDEDDGSLWLQVNVKSVDLYALVRETLSGKPFKCFEDGDAESEVELNEAFRLNTLLNPL